MKTYAFLRPHELFFSLRKFTLIVLVFNFLTPLAAENYFSNVFDKAFKKGDKSSLGKFDGALVKSSPNIPTKNSYVLKAEAKKYRNVLRTGKIHLEGGVLELKLLAKGDVGLKIILNLFKTPNQSISFNFPIKKEGWQIYTKQFLLPENFKRFERLDLVGHNRDKNKTWTLEVGELSLEKTPINLSTIKEPNYKAIGPYKLDKRESDIFCMETQYQESPQFLEIFTSNKGNMKNRPMILMLPVEGGFGSWRWGDIIQILQSKYKAKKLPESIKDSVFVSPAYAIAPWLNDNPEDAKNKLESYLMKIVLPFIQKKYQTDPKKVALIGFSKSGYSSINLLLRYPETFAIAASYDAPLMMRPEDFGVFKTNDIYGNQKNFDAYRPSVGLEKMGHVLKNRKSLIVMGEAFFGDRWCIEKGKSHTQSFHELLNKKGIEHIYNNKVKAAHSWNWKWLKPALEATAELMPE